MSSEKLSDRLIKFMINTPVELGFQDALRALEFDNEELRERVTYNTAWVERARELEAENERLNAQMVRMREACSEAGYPKVVDDLLEERDAMMDEIERLKGELENWQNLNANAHGQQACIDALRADNDAQARSLAIHVALLEEVRREKSAAEMSVYSEREVAALLQRERNEARTERDAALAKLERVRESCLDGKTRCTEYEGDELDCILAILDAPQSADIPANRGAESQNNDQPSEQFDIIEKEVVLWEPINKKPNHISLNACLSDSFRPDACVEIARATVQFKVPIKKTLAERFENWAKIQPRIVNENSLDDFIHEISALEGKVGKK